MGDAANISQIGIEGGCQQQRGGRSGCCGECDTFLSLAGDYATIFAKIFSLFCALHQMLTKCRCWRRLRLRLRRRHRHLCLCTLFTFIGAQINKFNAPTGKKEEKQSEKKKKQWKGQRKQYLVASLRTLVAVAVNAAGRKQLGTL